MKLVVGLGNPGKKYKGTRHNTGFLVLDELKDRISDDQFLISKQISNPKFQFKKKFGCEVLRVGEILLTKPQVFMNRSGEAVKKLTTTYNLSAQAGLQPKNLFVVHDDLDIKLGKYKIQFAKGPRQHNGLQSIYKKLGTKDFWHVRVGIEHRVKEIEREIPGEKYVLQNFSGDEKGVIDQVVSEVVGELLKKLS